jgi:hypothetical protein
MTIAPNKILAKGTAPRGLAAMGFVLLMAGQAVAQEAPQDIAVALETFKLVQTVDDAGVTRIERVAPETVLPGDRILYRIVMSNPAEEPATDLSLDLPIHEALVIAPDSFEADVAVEVTFATHIAPEEFMSFPELAVPTETGGTRPATPEDLGAVRVFIAELSALEAAFVEYEANVR